MKRILTSLFFLVFLICVLTACADPVRYSRMETDAADFHPRAIGILSVDVGPHESAAGVIDRFVFEELTRTGRYSRVLIPNDIHRIVEGEEARPVLEEYLSKLEIVNFSDPDLSRRLGEICRVDAFLLVSLSFWSYTVNTKDKNIAKVGLEMRLVEASTGRIVWTGHHFDEKRYRIVKPELADVGSSVARRLVRELSR